MSTDRDRHPGRVDVIVDDPALSDGAFAAFWSAIGREHSCFSIHRVELRETFTDGDSGRLMWRFRARDAESVRMALRCYGFDNCHVRIETSHGSESPME